MVFTGIVEAGAEKQRLVSTSEKHVFRAGDGHGDLRRAQGHQTKTDRLGDGFRGELKTGRLGDVGWLQIGGLCSKDQV